MPRRDPDRRDTARGRRRIDRSRSASRPRRAAPCQRSSKGSACLPRCSSRRRRCPRIRRACGRSSPTRWRPVGRPELRTCGGGRALRGPADPGLASRPVVFQLRLAVPKARLGVQEYGRGPKFPQGECVIARLDGGYRLGGLGVNYGSSVAHTSSVHRWRAKKAVLKNGDYRICNKSRETSVPQAIRATA